MRNAILPIAVAVAMFILGVFILNTQVWYTTRADGLAGARYVSKNIKVILNEARHATRMAMGIAEKGCGPEEQYQLGTLAALLPHLRTIIIVRQGAVWCSSLPGNRVLLVNINALPNSQLLLVPYSSTVNGLPVLLVQTKIR